jgi:hypothetical protein
MTCGLEVEPQVAFREGQQQKDNMRKRLLLSAVLLAGLAGVAQAAFVNIIEGSTEGSAPTVTYGGGVTLLDPIYTAVEYAAGTVALTPVSGDGDGALNVLWQEPGPGGSLVNSDYLHVEWALVNEPNGNIIRLQFQMHSQPFTLDPATVINITRTETPGLMYLTHADGLPDDLTIGVQSVVPEPTTMVAGALLLLPFGASTLRILRRRTA